MAARRLLIVMLVLLFVSTLAAALAPVEAPDEQADPPRTATERPSDPAGEAVGRTVEIGPGSPEQISIALGDQLSLTVRSSRLVRVEIPRLGLLETAEPESPARFDLLPPEPGSYPVRVLESGRTVARIEVGERRR